jgi:hypothetical protein
MSGQIYGLAALPSKVAPYKHYVRGQLSLKTALDSVIQKNILAFARN